jgi:DNA-binding CsgD family transcriptional regulator
MERKFLNRITSNQPFLKMAKDIDEIIQPIKKFGIHLFSYRKTFADGSRINFSNNADWLYDYFNLKLYQSSLFEYAIENYESGFSIWPLESKLSVFQHGRLYYNSDNGMTFTIKHADYCEFYIFGAHKNNKQMINVFINNLEFIKQFTEYFHWRTIELCKKAEQSLIKITPNSNDPSQLIYLYKKSDYLDAKKIFNDKTPSQESSVMQQLSPRERACIELLIKGKTAKEIGLQLNLAYRTIEFYLNNIRKKTGCRNKFELIRLFL